MRTTRAILVCVLVVAIGAAARIDAHPASDTSVVITFRDRRTVEIALASDATALVAKLEAFSSGPLSSSPLASRDALTARLISLGPTLTERTFLFLNGSRLRTRPGQVTVDDRGIATMHLEAELAEGSSLSWSTDLMYGAYALVVSRGNGNETIYWLDGQTPSGPIGIDSLMPPAISVWSGIWLGFAHIVPKGLDHILFVLGLFLLSPRLKQLVWQVSAFTIAHTVTLGLSLYGVVAAPGSIVEPLIALSVAYVGVENLLTSRLRPWRVVVVFCFGLLHGLGFAGAMSELPYSHAALIGMLVSFNVGVELGQLSVIAAAALTMRVVVMHRESWERPAARLASAGVCAAGLLWTVERVI